MSAEPTREQWRAAEPAVLRAYAQAETERSSMRAVAERIGMGRTTLYNFLAGANPHPRVRRLLALWYLRETGGVQVDADACAAHQAQYADPTALLAETFWRANPAQSGAYSDKLNQAGRDQLAVYLKELGVSSDRNTKGFDGK